PGNRLSIHRRGRLKNSTGSSEDQAREIHQVAAFRARFDLVNAGRQDELALRDREHRNGAIVGDVLLDGDGLVSRRAEAEDMHPLRLLKLAEHIERKESSL